MQKGLFLLTWGPRKVKITESCSNVGNAIDKDSLYLYMCYEV